MTDETVGTIERPGASSEEIGQMSSDPPPAF